MPRSFSTMPARSPRHRPRHEPSSAVAEVEAPVAPDRNRERLHASIQAVEVDGDLDVLDLADAHIAALELTGEMEPGQEIANLGSGSGFSVKQVLAAATEVVGTEIPHQYGARRQGDPPALIASNDRAEEVLGWRPKRGTLREMIGSAWALLQQQDRAGHDEPVDPTE